MSRRAATLALLALLAAPPAAAQQRPVARWVDAHQREVVEELTRFLGLPNVAADSANIRRNARALAEMLEERGLHPRLLETGGPPMVYAELPAPGATTTLLLYAHYDGQPADPAAWASGAPWKPTLLDAPLDRGGRPVAPGADGRYDPEWRLYARSASDDKSPIVAMLAALDALEATGARPTVNLKLLFEGEEEAGSAHLAQAIRDHRDLLASDLVVMTDGPMHPSNRPTVVYGARGITSAQITVYGADRPLHSGHYGNWAPNPAMELARLLASMKDADGRVLVAGWYDDVVPLGTEERAAIAAIPDEQPGDYGFAVPEGGEGARRLERIALPSLNVRGLLSGWVGADARTLVPDSAVAEIDMRLVPAVQPDAQVQRLVAHVRAQGYHVVAVAPDSATRARYPRIARVRYPEGGYPAARTPFDHPVARRLAEAVRRASPLPPVLMPTMGGSVPAAWFPVVTGTSTLLLPLVNMDNNQHAPNENLRLGNFFQAIETMAAVFTM